MDAQIEKLLLSKLRQPVHKTYICKYVFKYAEQGKCDEVLNKLVSEGKIEESPLASGYYVIKI
jgi:hypothetical protein